MVACAIVFGAAMVRGFSGFGFSLLAIPALSLFSPLPEILPPIFMMEITASLGLLPSLWPDIHWRSLIPLIAGSAVGTPIGVWFLSHFPPAPMQLALAGFILVAVTLMLRGWSLRRMPGVGSTVAVGFGTGVANGAFGIAGPPVVLFYFASPAGSAVGRASTVAFFLAIDLMAIAAFSSLAGFVTAVSFWRALVYLPFLAAG